MEGENGNYKLNGKEEIMEKWKLQNRTDHRVERDFVETNKASLPLLEVHGALQW